MRRIFAIAAVSAFAVASAAGAETWKTYAPGPPGLEWFYDADYSYRDAQTGRVVVLQAIGKPNAEPRMGPSGPGKADGVGSIMAFDCKAKTVFPIGSYSPKKPLAESATWRTSKAKKVESAEDKALMTAACAGADQLASK
jgi:hypothetical protein